MGLAGEGDDEVHGPLVVFGVGGGACFDNRSLRGGRTLRVGDGGAGWTVDEGVAEKSMKGSALDRSCVLRGSSLTGFSAGALGMAVALSIAALFLSRGAFRSFLGFG